MKREYIVAYEEAYADGVYFAHPIGELGQELVRCKECKHWHKWSDWEMFCGHFDGGIGSDADDFCSYGEVRDE